MEINNNAKQEINKERKDETKLEKNKKIIGEDVVIKKAIRKTNGLFYAFSGITIIILTVVAITVPLIINNKNHQLNNKNNRLNSLLQSNKVTNQKNILELKKIYEEKLLKEKLWSKRTIEAVNERGNNEVKKILKESKAKEEKVKKGMNDLSKIADENVKKILKESKAKEEKVKEENKKLLRKKIVTSTFKVGLNYSIAIRTNWRQMKNIVNELTKQMVSTNKYAVGSIKMLEIKSNNIIDEVLKIIEQNITNFFNNPFGSNTTRYRLEQQISWMKRQDIIDHKKWTNVLGIKGISKNFIIDFLLMKAERTLKEQIKIMEEIRSELG